MSCKLGFLLATCKDQSSIFSQLSMHQTQFLRSTRNNYQYQRCLWWGILFLTGCQGVSPVTSGQNMKTLGLVGVLGSCVLILVVLGLMIFLVFAGRRWPILQMLNPLLWLGQIPFLKPYMDRATRLQSMASNVQASGRKVQGALHENRAAPGREKPAVRGESGTIQVEQIKTATLPPPDQLASNSSGLIGRRIDRYQIDALLAQGQYGPVYQAYDLKLARPAALRIISQQNERLLAGLQAAAALDHPGIARLYDYEAQDNQLMILSEFVPGSRLDSYMGRTQGQVSLGQMLLFVAQAAEALDYAHQQGVVHGDLRPGHLLLRPAGNSQAAQQPITANTPLQLKLIDFGLYFLHPAGQLPPIMLPYLAPELLQGQSPTAQSDVYALGVILYELITGRLPYQVNNLNEALAQQRGEMVFPPGELRPGLPQPVNQVVLTAMHKLPAKRYGTAGQLAEALRQVTTLLGEKLNEMPNAVQIAEDAGLAQILVTCVGEPRRIVTLPGRKVSLGAAPDNQIVLPAKGVAPFHARLEQTPTGWRIVDLGSQTGTFIEGTFLLPDLAEEWLSDLRVNIGPYTLTWYEGKEEPAEDKPLDSSASPTAASLEVTLTPPYLELEAGQRADVQITLANQGTLVDHYHLSVTGISADWVMMGSNDLQLLPGSQAFLLLTIAPPHNSRATAGEHSYQVRVEPMANPEMAVSATGQINLKPFHNLIMALQPERFRNRGNCQVTLENQGNQAINCTISGRDEGQELSYKPPAEPIALPPGEQTSADLQVAALKRGFIGNPHFVQFEVQAVDPAGVTESRIGQLEIRPFLPTWLISIAVVFFLLLCVLGAILAPYALSLLPTPTPVITAVLLPTVTPAPTATQTPPPPPATCFDIQKSQPEAEDGDYTLYLNGNPTQPILIYCHNLATTPQAFLTLAKIDPGFNESTVNYPGTQLTTRYEKIAIDLASLRVIVNDITFATTEGNVPDYSDASVANYGTATGCNEGRPGTVIGRGNIDLSDTPFALADTVQFQTRGLDNEGQQAVISEDGKIVELTAGGRCGRAEAVNGLYLKYAP